MLDRTLIEQLIDGTDLEKRLIDSQPTKEQRDEQFIWKWLAFVLIYEMMFGKMKIQGGGYVQVSCHDFFFFFEIQKTKNLIQNRELLNL